MTYIKLVCTLNFYLHCSEFEYTEVVRKLLDVSGTLCWKCGLWWSSQWWTLPQTWSQWFPEVPCPNIIWHVLCLSISSQMTTYSITLWLYTEMWINSIIETHRFGLHSCHVRLLLLGNHLLDPAKNFVLVSTLQQLNVFWGYHRVQPQHLLTSLRLQDFKLRRFNEKLFHQLWSFEWRDKNMETCDSSDSQARICCLWGTTHLLMRC